MRITFLGTGTSVGVPAVGCDCETCLSDDPRDKRLRTSVLIEHGGQNIIVDASTDFRQQALSVGLKHLEAILFTHSHADHCFGLDQARRDCLFRDRNHMAGAAPHLLICIRACALPRPASHNPSPYRGRFQSTRIRRRAAHCDSRKAPRHGIPHGRICIRDRLQLHS
jgi:ribonuclease BN (tRNA processing enzyme)